MKIQIILAVTTVALLSGCANQQELAQERAWRANFHPANSLIRISTSISPDTVHGEEVYFKNQDDWAKPAKSGALRKYAQTTSNLYLGWINTTGAQLNPGALRWITAKIGGDYYLYQTFPLPKNPSISFNAIYIFATPSRQLELKEQGVLRMTLQEARQNAVNSQQKSNAGSLLLNGSTL